MRADLGFDFGRFDYGLVDGRAVLYDANATPTYGCLDASGFTARLEHLAGGLEDFLH